MAMRMLLLNSNALNGWPNKLTFSYVFLRSIFIWLSFTSSVNVGPGTPAVLNQKPA